MDSLCRHDHVFTDVRIRAIVFTLLFVANAAVAQVDPLGINPDSDEYGRYASIGTIAGDPIIAYEDRDGTGGMTVTYCNTPACRFPDSRLLDPEGTANSAGVFATLLTPSDGLPVIVHAKLGGGSPIRVAKCSNSLCSPVMGAPPTTLVDVGSTGFSPTGVSAAVGSDNFPIISASLQDGGSHQGLWIIKCSDPFCMGTVMETQIDPARLESGRLSVIAIGADDLPIVAYQDRTSTGSNGNLMLLKCNDPACLGGDESFSELAPLSGFTDRPIDLAIGPGGNPVIAFATEVGGLGVIACNDPACVGDDESFNVVTTQGVVGFAVALAMNTLGHPTLAAHGFGSSDGSLQVIACNDTACAGDNEKTLEFFSDADPSIRLGRYVDITHAGNDIFSLVYMRREQISSSQFNRSLRALACTLEGCGVILQDGFEEPTTMP